MIKQLKALCLTAAIACTSTALSFTNLIVFGDSLSDNGNFPESPNAFIHSDQAKVVGNTSTSFYVPFSNPVNPLQGSATPPLADSMQRMAWPQLDPSLLAPQVPINSDSQRQRRRYRSLSWTELFLYYAKLHGLTQSAAIVPSYKVATQPIMHHASVNYAWGSALASSGCFDKAYSPFKHCDRNSVLNARLRYMQAPTTQNRYRIQVPAITTQVQFFLNDYKQQRIRVDHTTLYAFWAGGNNMINAYNHLLKWHIGDVLTFIFARPTAVNLNAITTLRESLPAQVRPRHFYVFNLMNPGLTPGYYHSNVQTLAYVLSNIYNWFSRVRVDWYNLVHSTKVEIVPVYQWYQQAHSMSYFRNHLGKACQIDGGDFSRADRIPNNCPGFMYWNDVHPAVDMQMITAYRFMQLLQSKT